MMDRLNLTQGEISEKLGRSKSWVADRLTLALNLVEPVRKMIADDLLTPSRAVFIARLPPEKQAKFAELVVKKQKKLGKTLNRAEMRLEIRKFQNDTIYTIGYEGQNLDNVIEKLKENDIKLLLDIRDSVKSLQKPEFSGKFLQKNLQASDIIYENRKDLGAPYDIREAYIKGGLSQECFESWYMWSVTSRDGDKIPELINHIKSSGKTALMCYEKDVKSCHRDILAKIIMQTKNFEKRKDL